MLGTAALGYRAGDWLRIELEYFYRDSAFNRTSPILGASGETREKLVSEMELARERVYSVTSSNLFGNVYVDLGTGNRFTPYLGFGAGTGFTDIDNGRVLARRLDPTEITSADHLPNAEEVRRNLAGTTTAVLATDSDTVRAYQVLFGTDVALAEAVSLGFKGRWVWYGTFEASGSLDQLRSHPPAYRRDGSRPVTYHRIVEGSGMVGVDVELKYHF
ncbi:MAG: outer membrane beta-barrel protein [Acidobacteria bacterium]|nr:outer membrane beta-barrel protein [Acidobacteriota bacterium]